MRSVLKFLEPLLKSRLVDKGKTTDHFPDSDGAVRTAQALGINDNGLFFRFQAFGRHFDPNIFCRLRIRRFHLCDRRNGKTQGKEKSP